MHVETKFLRLRKPAALDDDIDGWRVCWLGGWGRDKLFCFVMVAKAGLDSAKVEFRCDVDAEHQRRVTFPVVRRLSRPFRATY